MGGLALGSSVIGNKADDWDDRKIALIYVGIELVIGIYALLFPLIVGAIENIYIKFFTLLPTMLWASIFVKIFFSVIILILPTFLMGTTLPLITRYLSRNWNDYSKNISLLYALNTFGAIIGTLIAGFYLLEHYGISGATIFAAMLNFSVALSFLLFWKFLPSMPTRELSLNKKEKKTIIKKSDFAILLLISYILSGAASMFYQVAWTRSLSLVLGTSTYAFTTILATFLLGIALGSVLYRYIPKNYSRVKLYIFIQLLIVFSVLISSMFFDKLPIYYLQIRDVFFESWIDLHYIRFIISGAIILIPTIGMGLLFPIVCNLISNENKKMSFTVGKVYAFNSVGAMLGSILAGLAVIPAVGLQYTIYIGAFLSLFSFIIIILQTEIMKNSIKISFTFLSVIFFLIFISSVDRWSPRVMSSGVYTYADNYFMVSDRFESAGMKDKYSNESIWEAAMKNYDLLYYKDGRVDTVAVMRNKDDVISLMVNGKVDASAKGDIDIVTQIMIGQLPLLLHKNPQNVFLIGYASGITAGSILTHPIKSLDAAEISSSVIEASKLFNKYNNNPLSDERMNLKINDAKHMLMISDKKYDVIVSQPSNPWIKGQSSLFSYEWYNIVKKHLADDAIFMQWLPAYNISERNLKIIINTLASVFPNLSLWTSSSPGDLILLASNNKEFKTSYNNLIEKAKYPSISKQLDKIGLKSTTLLKDLFLKNNDEVKKYLTQDLDKPLVINNDDRLITEFTAPKDMANNRLVKLFSKEKYLTGKEHSLKVLVPDLP